MNWGRRIAVITLACAGVLAIVLLLPRSREPVYRGRTLSWWIHQYDEANLASNLDRRDEAQRAIQQIGTNALPTLLDWLRYDQPRWRGRLRYRLSMPGQAPVFLQKPTLEKLAEGAAGRHASDARKGFAALGPAAYPAAVELVALSASKSSFVSHNAEMAIWAMQGPKAPVLAPGLTNSDSRVRRRAAELIGVFFQHLPSPLPSDDDFPVTGTPVRRYRSSSMLSMTPTSVFDGPQPTRSEPLTRSRPWLPKHCNSSTFPRCRPQIPPPITSRILSIGDYHSWSGPRPESLCVRL